MWSLVDWLWSMASCNSEHGLQSPIQSPEHLHSTETETISKSSENPAICSAISLSQWLQSPASCADVNGLHAYEVEQAERSAFESFMQGYSLL